MQHTQAYVLLLALLLLTGCNNKKPSQPVAETAPVSETSATPSTAPAAPSPEVPRTAPELPVPAPSPQLTKNADVLAETITAVDLQSSVENGKKEPQGEIQISGIVSGFTPYLLNEEGQPQAMLLLEGGRLCIMKNFLDIQHASSPYSGELGIPCFFDDAKSIHGIAIGDTVVLKGDLKEQTVNDLLIMFSGVKEVDKPARTFRSYQLHKSQLVDHKRGKIASPPPLTFEDVINLGKGTANRQKLLSQVKKKNTFVENEDLIRVDVRLDAMVELRPDNFTPQMRAILNGIPLISSLTMSYFNADMVNAVASLPYCESLSIDPDEKHSVSTIETLLKTPGLHSLRLDKPQALSADDFKILESIPGLRSFRLDGGFSSMYQETGNQALAYLCKTPDLRSLEIYKIGVSDDGMACLKTMPELHTLVLNGCPLTGSWIKSLAAPESLWKLDVDGRTLNDDFASGLGMLVNLQRLRIHNANLTSKSLVDSLSKMTRMQHLVLLKTDVDSEIGTAFNELKELQFLTLSQTNTIKEDFSLPAESLPVLYNINLSHTTAGDKALVSLAKSTSLLSIDLASTLVTDQGVEEFVTNHQCKKLQHINLGYTKVTPAGLSQLTKIPSLKKITVQKDYELPENILEEMKKTNPGLEVIFKIMMEVY
jgi:hypothetical protein